MKYDHTFTMINRKESPYMEYIKSGMKHAEGRVDSKGFSKLNVGDIIYFHNRNQGIICKITFLNKYENFAKMLETEGVNKMLPQLRNIKIAEKEKIDKGVKIYERFPNSYKAKKYGCLAIGVKYISDLNPSR